MIANARSCWKGYIGKLILIPPLGALLGYSVYGLVDWYYSLPNTGIPADPNFPNPFIFVGYGLGLGLSVAMVLFLREALKRRPLQEGLGIYQGQMEVSQVLAPVTPPSSDFPAVAPVWHTIVLLTILMGISMLGAISGIRAQRVIQYGSAMMFEWSIVAFICWGLRRRGVRVADLVGGTWARSREILRDTAIGITFLIVNIIVLGITVYLLKAVPNQALRNLLPKTRTEMILWVLLSFTAGFCEELIFRGYLQRQFATLTQSAAAAILLQGVAFGAAHGYQGWEGMVVRAVNGTLLGFLAQWRHSTRPGMITHAVGDTIAGFLGRYLIR